MTCKIIAQKHVLPQSPCYVSAGDLPWLGNIRTIPSIVFMGDIVVNFRLRKALKFLSIFFPRDRTSWPIINTTTQDCFGQIDPISNPQMAAILARLKNKSYFYSGENLIKIHPSTLSHTATFVHELVHALRVKTFKGYTDMYLATTMQYLCDYLRNGYSWNEFITREKKSILTEGKQYFDQYPTKSVKYSEEINTIAKSPECFPENYQAGYFVAGIISAMIIDAKHTFEDVKVFLQLLADGRILEEAVDSVHR